MAASMALATSCWKTVCSVASLIFRNFKCSRRKVSKDSSDGGWALVCAPVCAKDGALRVRIENRAMNGKIRGKIENDLGIGVPAELAYSESVRGRLRIDMPIK